MSEEKQMDLKVSEEEFNAIKKAAEDKDTSVKDLILQSVKRYSSDENQEEPHSNESSQNEQEESSSNDDCAPPNEESNDERDNDEQEIDMRIEAFTPCVEVEECIRKSEGLTGFSMEKLCRVLETRAMDSKSLDEKDINAILLRLMKHSKFWSHSDEEIASKLDTFSKTINSNPSEMRRKYFELDRHISKG